MNWTVALSKIYDIAQEKGENILPLFCSTINAPVELTLSESGEFLGAVIIKKADSVTLIPVTESSAARGSGIAPMPFVDKFAYIAGDFGKYTGEDNQNKFQAYMEQLKNWKDSKFAHYALEPVYTYLSKGCLIYDLVKNGVLHVGDNGLLDKTTFDQIAQKDLFVRFIIDYKDPSKEKNTWQDASLRTKFQEYILDKIDKEPKQLCYATGEKVKATYTHPAKIRHASDGAKLISANDDSGFTYRGRFRDKKDAISVGYLFSQKMHNSLKWLIASQNCRLNTLNIVAWASELQEIPLITSPSFRIDKECEPFKTLEDYEEWLKNRMDEYRKNMSPETRVMILAIDSCSTGRVPVTYYDEMPASEYLDHVYTWFKNSAWLGYHANEKCMTIKAYSPYDYVRAAYGIEQKYGLGYETQSLYPVAGSEILKLMPSITRGREVPDSLIDKLYQNVANPDFYERDFSNYVMRNTLCSVLRLKKKGEVSMGYNPQETNRSYLYGCLLAFADKAELDTYPPKDRNKIVTNARRYWTAFTRTPYQTWQLIEERLRVYLNKHPYRTLAEKHLNEIMSKFNPADFTDNSRLDAVYLLGYHHYTEYLYNWAKENTNESFDEEDFEV